MNVGDWPNCCVHAMGSERSLKGSSPPTSPSDCRTALGMQLRLTPAGIDLAGEREREAARVSAGILAVVTAARRDGAEG